MADRGGRDTKGGAGEAPVAQVPILKLYREGTRDFSGQSRPDEQASDGNLEGAWLSRCNFKDACFDATNLTRTNLDGAILAGASLSRADLTRANLRGAVLADARLERAVLERADMTGADLRYANLRKADLTDARAVNAQFDDADLRGADLSGANLDGASLARATLSRAVVSRTTILPAEFQPAGRGMLLDTGEGVEPLVTPLAPAAATRHEGPWWKGGAPSCDRCAVPLSHKHHLDNQTVCTACFLHDRGSRLSGDVHGALALMEDRGICAYCGEYAEFGEDIPGGDLGRSLRVKCCKECRELSAKHSFPDFSEKRDFLEQALSRRYAHVAGAQEWDESELSALEGNLRYTAELREQARKIVQGRLAFDFRKFIGR